MGIPTQLTDWDDWFDNRTPDVISEKIRECGCIGELREALEVAYEKRHEAWKVYEDPEKAIFVRKLSEKPRDDVVYIGDDDPAILKEFTEKRIKVLDRHIREIHERHKQIENNDK